MFCLLESLDQHPILKLLHRFSPDQAGALWIGVLVTFLVAWDFDRPFRLRNFGVLLLLVPALPLIDIMRWESQLSDPKVGWFLGVAFRVLYGITALMVLWSLVLAFWSRRDAWVPSFSIRTLRWLVALLILLNGITALSRPGEDAGPYTSLGARRWIETGTIPYGDAALRGPKSPGGGAAATYGPLLYLAHLPFHVLTNAATNPPDIEPMSPAYLRPPDIATRLTCLTFYLLLLAALYATARSLAGAKSALGILVLYAGSSYVLGLGDDRYPILGLTFLSHVAPVAMILLSVALHRFPILSGMALAGGAGMLFYPAFFFPLFFGYYFWRKAGAWRFAAGFGAVGAAIVALVYLSTGSLDGKSPIELFMEATLEHQEGGGEKAYGTSKFSFFGTHPEIAEMVQRPLFGSGSTLKPTFLGFIGLCLLSFFFARGRTLVGLCALIAMLSAAIQLWKTHAGGTYVEWYYPFLLLALFACPKRPVIDAPKTEAMVAAT